MPQLFDQLRDFLAEVENEKQASVKKRAEANTETTSQGGPSTHPSKSQEDGTLPATEGKRSQENTGDVKDAIPAGGVDAASDKAPAQADQQLNVGITSTATGEDPANEDNYKEKKDDPGTAHAATVGSEKYSSLSFGELRKLASDKANEILADITSAVSQPAPAASNRAESLSKAAAAGVAAASITEEEQVELIKNAQAAISGSIENAIADGLEKAAMVGAYLQAFYKAASEGEAAGAEGEAASEEAAPEEGAGQGGMEVDPALLSQMSGEEAAPAAAAPEASEEDSIQELLMALQEQGIDPAQLLQMIQGGEGETKAASAKLDASTAELVNWVKKANAQRNAQIKAGKFRITEAKTAQQRGLRDQIKACVRDIIG